MANLLDWNTLEHITGTYIDEASGIDTLQKAFPILMVRSLLDVSDEEAEDSITDGPKDRGVDAVFVDERDGRNNIHLFQFKYVKEFKSTKKNFPSNEIDKLVSFLDDLLDEEQALKKTCNSILWSKVKEIWSALKRPSPEIIVHFCGNQECMVAGEKDRADAAIGKFKYITVNHHNLDSILEMFVAKKSPKVDGKLQVVDKDYFDRTDGRIRGMICTVEAKEIVQLIADPKCKGQVNADIFNDNVRIYLKKNNRINRKIIESATSDEGSLFWYLNNGITITCDQFSYPKGTRAPSVGMKNLQIVNGGQTSNALFEAFQMQPDRLEDVLLLVRIIETKSQDVSLAIAESTNSQTPIKTRDLRSNDDIQKKLEEAFEGMGYFYERKLNQHAEKPKKLRIDALVAGQAYLAYSLEMPEVAKKDRGRIFSDLYDTVFTDDLIADHLLCAVKVLAAIDVKKKELQANIRKGFAFEKRWLFLIDGAYHVLFTVSQLAEARNLDRNDFSKAQELIEDAIEYVAVVVEAEQNKVESFSFNRFFKDTRTKSKLVTAVAAREAAAV